MNLYIFRVNADLLEATCRLGFGKRRKFLKNVFKGYGLPVEEIEKLLDGLDINKDARAENLTVKDWCKLGLALNEKIDIINTSSSTKLQLKE